MAGPYRVTVRETGGSFFCAEDQAVLLAMIHAGSGPVKHGCCGGGCGICRMKIVSGEWRSFKPMSHAHAGEADQKEGIVLLCCVQPKSDLIIAGV
jgi:ferredoxin